MCCIVYKPKGIEMPNVSVLNRIKSINHDGYGFVSSRHHFKTLDYGAFLAHLSKVTTDEECLIHLRYATHGSVCRQNCHPFKRDNVWFMHNGVLPIVPVKNHTDSETAFILKIYPVIKKYSFDSIQTDKAIMSIIGSSRFAFMHDGEVRLYGDYKEIGGIYYSNLRWMYI